ncbi:MAG: BlaI/MecI/CopY family transcriptional regulator [Verrucomicrobiales bacterium]|jgi:predicted transcriptional regulator|tara:strand:+ start:32201 stop:32569 length:369 start_codon:yes stop_codon:yes gene_type:complete
MNRLEKGQVSRRERQILDILYRLGEATAQDVLEELPDPPSYSAVRALLATLENKEMVKHTKDGRRYLYAPMITERKAKRTALKGLLHTFFQGKPQNLVAALLDPSDQNLSREEIKEIRKLVE